MKNKGNSPGWKTLEVRFDPHVPLKTDLTLYGELAGLLIPEPGQWNTFSIACDSSDTRYYISSTYERGADNLEAFFRKVYPCRTKTERIPGSDRIRRFFIVPRFMIRNCKFSYTPGLLRTIARGPSLFNKMGLVLHVTITSARSFLGRRMRYSFWIDVGFNDGLNHSESMKDLVRSALDKMILDHGIPLKILRERRRSFNSYPLSFRNPLDLVNVIRIIEDENLTSEISQQAYSNQPQSSTAKESPA